MTKHASDSTEQQNAESAMLHKLESDLGLSFESDCEIPIAAGVKPDAVDYNNRVLVEVYAHIGKLKGAQLHKVKGDILKLILIEKKLGGKWRKIICFANDEASSYLKNNSWVAEAARSFEIEVVTVVLPVEHQKAVIAAQSRQRMVNPT